jgi:hypothetical protein
MPKGRWKITSNTTLSAPTAFEPGAEIQVDDWKALTIAPTCRITAGHHQIFRLGTGSKVYGLRQSGVVSPHWWGITESSAGAAAANAASIKESLSSFVHCKLSLGRMSAYFTSASFAVDSTEGGDVYNLLLARLGRAPTAEELAAEVAIWEARRFDIDGEGAELICNADAESLTTPMLVISGGRSLSLRNCKIGHTTTPTMGVDALVGYQYAVSIGGTTSTFARRVSVDNVEVENGRQCGIVMGHCDSALAQGYDVRNVVGSGLYFVNVRYNAHAGPGHVGNTGDDHVAFVCDSNLSEGTLLASVNGLTGDVGLASTVTFGGPQVCHVNGNVVARNTYSAGIRAEVGADGQVAKVIRIDGPTLIRCGRQTSNGTPNTQGSASGVALGGITGAEIHIKATAIDCKYAGAIVQEDCKSVDVSGLDVEGASDDLGQDDYTIDTAGADSILCVEDIDAGQPAEDGLLKIGTAFFRYASWASKTFSGVSPTPNGLTGTVTAYTEEPTYIAAYLGADDAPSTIIDRAVVDGLRSRHTNHAAIYASNLKNVRAKAIEASDAGLLTPDGSPGTPAVIGFIDCDAATYDKRNSTLSGAGSDVDSSGTTTYVELPDDIPA